MRTRAASLVAVISLGFGVASVILAGLAYAEVLETRASVPTARVLRFLDASVPDPSLPGYPALPDADHLPTSFTEQQREDATIWLQQQAYVDECMFEAGYPGWSYFAHWQTGAFAGMQGQWLEGFSESERDAAFLALNGDPEPDAYAGIAYKWEDGGCQGRAWHKVGIDWPVVY